MSTPCYQVVNNDNLRHVSFSEAIDQYLAGKTIECRLLNKRGEVVGWEKYHVFEGMEIALEFNEIINGMWFVIEQEV